MPGRTRCSPREDHDRGPGAHRARDPGHRLGQGPQPVTVDEESTAGRGEGTRHRPLPDLGLREHPAGADGREERDVEPRDVVGDHQQTALLRGGPGEPHPDARRPHKGPAPGPDDPPPGCDGQTADQREHEDPGISTPSTAASRRTARGVDAAEAVASTHERGVQGALGSQALVGAATSGAVLPRRGSVIVAVAWIAAAPGPASTAVRRGRQVTTVRDTFVTRVRVVFITPGRARGSAAGSAG